MVKAHFSLDLIKLLCEMIMKLVNDLLSDRLLPEFYQQRELLLLFVELKTAKNTKIQCELYFLKASF